MSEFAWKNKFDQVIQYQLKKFFQITDNISRSELLSKYKQLKGNTQEIWHSISQDLKTPHKKVYKYFTNTWSRTCVDKWPKLIKINLKKMIIQKIIYEFQDNLSLPTQRLQILSDFIKSNLIKERYQQYHFDSLYFYLYNILTSELSKMYKTKLIYEHNVQEAYIDSYLPENKIQQSQSEDGFQYSQNYYYDMISNSSLITDDSSFQMHSFDLLEQTDKEIKLSKKPHYYIPNGEAGAKIGDFEQQFNNYQDIFHG